MKTIVKIAVLVISFMTISSLLFSSAHSANGVVSGYLFSDGFESGDFSHWSGTRQSAGETVSINDTYTHQGNYSAELTSNGGESREYAYCYARSASSSASELYARAYFKITSSGIGSAIDTRFSLIVFKAGTNAIAFAGWRQTNNGVRWSLLIKDSAGWVTKYSAMNPSVNRWYCVELHLLKDEVNGCAELFVDGDLVCATAGKNTAAFGSINEVDLGIAGTLDCASTTVYMDSTVISKTYVGLLPSDLWFASIEYLPYSDGDGDGCYEAFGVRINVDTSDATANVTVKATCYYTIDGFPMQYDWIFTGKIDNKNVEYFNFSVDGWLWEWRDYILDVLSFSYVLYDDVGNVEDYRFDKNVVIFEHDFLVPWVYQDSFENGDFRLESGVKTTSGETANVTKELSHAGSHSAKFTTNGDGGYESSYFYWMGQGADPVAGGCFYVAVSGIEEDMDRFGLIQFEASGNVVVSAGWRQVDGIVRWSVAVRNGSTWLCALSNEVPSTGQWYSLWLYGKGEWGEGLDLRVNGVSVCHLAVDTSTLFGSVGIYRLGLAQTVNCGKTTVYVDEAAADWFGFGE